jgi:hypothetical protein
MIRRVMIAALVFAATVCLVSAQDTKVSVDMIGIGRMSCVHWRSTQAHRLEGTIWVYGFWTGLNYVAAASDQTQAKIDSSRKDMRSANVADISQRRVDHLS